MKAGKIGTKYILSAKCNDVVAGKIGTKTTSCQMQPWKNRNQNKLPARCGNIKAGKIGTKSILPVKCNDVVAGKIGTKTNFSPDAATIDTGKIGTKTNFPPDKIKRYQSKFPQKQPPKKLNPNKCRTQKK